MTRVHVRLSYVNMSRRDSTPSSSEIQCCLQKRCFVWEKTQVSLKITLRLHNSKTLEPFVWAVLTEFHQNGNILQEDAKQTDELRWQFNCDLTDYSSSNLLWHSDQVLKVTAS